MKRTILKKAIALLLMAILIVGSSLPSFGAPALAGVPIYRDYENYTFAERAADMVARMTLAQKTGNMVSSTTTAVPVGDDEQGGLSTGVKQYGWWGEALHGLNRNESSNSPNNATSYPMPYAMAQSWDPNLIYDVYSEVSNEIRERVADFYRGLNFYSPVVMEPARDPRWGRVTEGLGEDPVLAAILGAQVFNGFQGFEMDGKTLVDPNGYWKANTTAKHYLANSSEVNRLNGVSNLTEQEHREYYGLPYKELMRRAEPASVMSSYNRIQIKHTAYSPFLELPGGINSYTLDTLLRQTYGFKGYVTGDCDSVRVAGQNSTQTRDTREGQGADGYSETNHGWRAPSYTWYGETTKTADQMTSYISDRDLAAWGVMSGAELECSGGVSGGNAYRDQLPVSDENAQNALITPLGRYTESAVDVALAELMEARLRVGEWDSTDNYLAAPSQAKSTNRVSWYDKARSNVQNLGLSLPTGTSLTGSAIPSTDATMTPERLALADRAAGQSLVLLRNNIDENVNGGKPLLPMTFPEEGDITVGVYGTMRTNTHLGLYSSGRSGGGTAKQVNPLAGITAALKAKYPGRNVTVNQHASVGEEAANYDYVIAVVGDANHTNLAAEQYDRRNFNLGTGQNNGKTTDIETVKGLYSANKKLIVVAITSGTIGEATTSTSVDNMYESIPAMLYAPYLGDRPGTGIGDVLVGNVNPSARTVSTWYPKSTNYGSPVALGQETDSSSIRDNWGSLNQIRSYRLSPGVDGPWQSPYGDAMTTPYTFNPNGPNLGRTYMYYTGTGDNSILFPFGFGLSYTTFAYSEPIVKINGVVQEGDAAINVQPNDKVEYTFTVTNTGDVAGAEVAQLYVKTPADVYALSDTGSYGQAYAIKRLKDFQKTKTLQPNESETITLSVDVPDLAFWSNANKKYELMQLDNPYTLQVSRSAADEWEYQGEKCGAMLTREMRIANAANWNPKVSVVSFKPNTPEDAANDIPERLLYEAGDIVNPNPTVSMANDVLYGYINRMYSSADEQMYPIPENITITYESNRDYVAEVKEDGTIEAIGGGVATITGTATDSITGSSVSSEFIVYVQGKPADIDHDTTMKEFTWNGDTFQGSEGVKSYDVYVPENITNVEFTAENVTASFPDDVSVVVTLDPADGKVSPGKPCVATVKISSNEVIWSDVYTINFGRMTVEWEPDENYMGYNTHATVRFSDGETDIRLIQAWAMQKTGFLDLIVSEEFEAVPKHGSDRLVFFYRPEGQSDTLPAEWLQERTLSKYAWDSSFAPIAPAVKVDWLPPVIDGIQVGGQDLADFDPETMEYEYVVPFGSATPRVSASYDDTQMTVAITQASTVPGSAVITATNPHGTATSTYKVNFKRGENPNKATAVRGTPADAMDPNDPAWATANELLFNKRSSTNQSASIEASGKARILWDDSYLYARVEVTKNYPLNSSNSQNHLKDSVELFFSERNFRGNYGSTVANGNQYRVNYLGATSQKSSNSGWTGSGTILEGLSEGQYGYVLTYRIPWVDSAIPKVPGTAFGLDLQINAMETSNLRTCFAWSDGTDSGYNSSNLWGELILG